MAPMSGQTLVGGKPRVTFPIGELSKTGAAGTVKKQSGAARKPRKIPAAASGARGTSGRPASVSKSSAQSRFSKVQHVPQRKRKRSSAGDDDDDDDDADGSLSGRVKAITHCYCLPPSILIRVPCVFEWGGVMIGRRVRLRPIGMQPRRVTTLTDFDVALSLIEDVTAEYQFVNSPPDTR